MEVAAHLSSIRDCLVKNESIGATRIVLIDGGFREKQEIELSILAAPTLKPEEGRLKKSVSSLYS